MNIFIPLIFVHQSVKTSLITIACSLYLKPSPSCCQPYSNITFDVTPTEFKFNTNYCQIILHTCWILNKKIGHRHKRHCPISYRHPYHTWPSTKSWEQCILMILNLPPLIHGWMVWSPTTCPQTSLSTENSHVCKCIRTGCKNFTVLGHVNWKKQQPALTIPSIILEENRLWDLKLLSTQKQL